MSGTDIQNKKDGSSGPSSTIAPEAQANGKVENNFHVV